MSDLPVCDQIKAIAERIIWFEPPGKALSNVVRFLAYAFSRASWEDMQALRQYLNDEELREALDRAPPGIIDARSWACWNAKFGRYPAPAMPQRRFG